jgi:hypothetical protein
MVTIGIRGRAGVAHSGSIFRKPQRLDKGGSKNLPKVLIYALACPPTARGHERARPV